MAQKLIIALIVGFLFSSCQEKKSNVSTLIQTSKWNFETLSEKATEHLDSAKWDLKLLKQDIETYDKYAEVFQSYPLNKSPFPVAEYDYAVSSLPFTIEQNGSIFKGVRIGEYQNPESEEVTDKLTLLVLTNDKNSEETTLVESRNFPYLTAQGYFKVSNNDYEWVFSASPDGYSTLIINMKLFDLRFGETIIIYPQIDKSFLYDQIKDSPNKYENFEDFKKSIAENKSVKKQLTSERNIK